MRLSNLIKAFGFLAFVIALGVIGYGGFFDSVVRLARWHLTSRFLSIHDGVVTVTHFHWTHHFMPQRLIDYSRAKDTIPEYKYGSIAIFSSFILLGCLNLWEQKVYEATVLKPNWFYELDLRSIGPIPEEDLRRWIREREILTDQLVRRKEETEWRKIADIPELKSEIPPEAPPAETP